MPGQFVIVFYQPVVDIDQGSGDVAIGRVSVVCRELLVLLIGGGIDRNRRLLQLGGELAGLGHLQQPGLGSGKEDMKSLDVGIPAPLLVLRKNPLCVLLVIRRSDMMRSCA